MKRRAIAVSSSPPVFWNRKHPCELELFFVVGHSPIRCVRQSDNTVSGGTTPLGPLDGGEDDGELWSGRDPSHQALYRAITARRPGQDFLARQSWLLGPARQEP
ncbi:uncharacterized protein LOC62_06G007885 [Vanrija pseudolonga]|uniref:Uncharacterized protein n=1 Tax=Vanrija pseudolonga TaxID=143232 RepID=A0AAF0YCT2_9TREE|nr:hypothetical protein LOC62_06G007885 [Vanrija pseudolonga]